jgi:hypothetical protein
MTVGVHLTADEDTERRFGPNRIQFKIGRSTGARALSLMTSTLRPVAAIHSCTCTAYSRKCSTSFPARLNTTSVMRDSWPVPVAPSSSLRRPALLQGYWHAAG